jgi:hypothetical protein
MMRKYLIWFLVGPLIVVMGLLGWNYMRDRSLAQKARANTQQVSGPQPYLPPEDETPPDPETLKRLTLVQAIERFRSAKSFRVNLKQPLSEGTLQGQLEYVRPLRLHAALTYKDSQNWDLIIIGETVYVRTGEDSWEMSNVAFAKDFGRQFFSSMLLSEGTLASFGVADDALIATQEDRAKKCTIFKTQYLDQEKKAHDIQFCVNANKDVIYIKTQTDQGLIESEYRDFNAMFLIERPRLPLLQPRRPEIQEPTATSTATP